jgi:uncharacterized membrane protein YqgA involved in biofilm formation
MIKKIILGIIIASIIGMFVSSFFVSKETKYLSLFLSKITATSLITSIFIAIYASLSKSKIQVFLISVLIGMVIFYAKYLITGHDLDALTMGAFVGAMLGGAFAIEKKIDYSRTLYKRLKRLRNSNFKDYSESSN